MAIDNKFVTISYRFHTFEILYHTYLFSFHNKNFKKMFHFPPLNLNFENNFESKRNECSLFKNENWQSFKKMILNKQYL